MKMTTRKKKRSSGREGPSQLLVWEGVQQVHKQQLLTSTQKNIKDENKRLNALIPY